MKREEIKSDPIKDKIVEVINLFVDNSKMVWSVILAIVLGISVLTYLNSSNKNILLEHNLNSGIMQNRFIHSDEDKALLVSEYKSVMLDFDANTPTHNQAYIYLMDYYLMQNDFENIDLLLKEGFSSNNNMMNSYYYKIKGDYFSKQDLFDDAILNYKKSIDFLESYDLKIIYTSELINLLIKIDRIDNAKNMFKHLSSDINKVENLGFSAKNNFDYLESKLLHLGK